MNRVMELEVEPEVETFPVNGNVPTMNEKSTSDHVLTASEPEASSVVDVAPKGKKPFPLTTVTYHTLRYYVTIGSGCRGKKTCKQILHEPSGIFTPGVNAIMGPTGCGKTTLLDILSGRTESRGVFGHVLVNGQLPPHNFKFQNGYVVQDDVVVGTLTVRENLMFSANLRLPKTKTTEQKRRRVEKTILELGLTRCADTRVGTEFIRGVSGGERKRTNIGMELIIKPAILFLDEPTTGLDASTAKVVISLLHRGRTVIFSIHQPRYSIFKLFDRLTLLAAGRTVYHGPASEAQNFFNAIGYTCENFNNPPDFFLDVINGDASELEPSQHDRVQQTVPHESTVEVVQELSLAEQISTSYNRSEWAQRVDEILKPILMEYANELITGRPTGKQTGVPGQRYKTSFSKQFKYLSRRVVINLIRDPQTALLQTFISVFFGFLLGFIYFQTKFQFPGGLQDRLGSLFFISVNQLVFNISGNELFARERLFFVHENASGYYRVSAYLFSKIVADFIPMKLVPLIVFSVMAYFMIGFQTNAVKFFIFFLVLFLTTMAGAALVFAINTSFKRFAVANLIKILIFIVMTLVGGIFLNLADMPVWLRWLPYLSIIYYSFNALIINELDGESFYPVTNGSQSPTNSTVKIAGTQYLASEGIPYQTAWDFWLNIMALCLITIGLLLIGYIQLRRMKKLK